jgi:hypothetical protein
VTIGKVGRSFLIRGQASAAASNSAAHPPCTAAWHRGDQGLREGIGRALQNGFGGADFDNSPILHHRDPVRHSANGFKVMADEKQRQATFAADAGQQIQHLRLHCHVERRDRLITDQ